MRHFYFAGNGTSVLWSDNFVPNVGNSLRHFSSVDFVMDSCPWPPDTRRIRLHVHPALERRPPAFKRGQLALPRGLVSQEVHKLSSKLLSDLFVEDFSNGERHDDFVGLPKKPINFS